MDNSLVKRLLLFRARMHLGDLDRVISQLLSTRLSEETGDPWTLALDDQTVIKNAGYKIAVFYQLCIEFLIHDEEMKSRLTQDPDFYQSVYDALYYPARRWESGEHALIASKPAFREYMLFRRGTEKKSRTAADKSTTTLGSIPDTDLAFLREQMLRLLDLMQDPTGQMMRLRSDPAMSPTLVREEIFSVVIELGTIPPIIRRTRLEEPDEWTWLVDEYGRALEPDPMRTLQALNDFLQKHFGITLDILGKDFHLVPDMPVCEAGSVASGGACKIKSNPADLQEFWSALREYCVLLRSALYYAALLAEGDDPSTANLDGLRRLREEAGLRADIKVQERVNKLELAFDHISNQADEDEVIRDEWNKMTPIDDKDILGWLPVMISIFMLATTERKKAARLD
jgi:hypothetical protein